MFETVRKNQKILQIILLILIVPSFVFLGVDSYTKSGDSKTDIAKKSYKLFFLYSSSHRLFF